MCYHRSSSGLNGGCGEGGYVTHYPSISEGQADGEREREREERERAMNMSEPLLCHPVQAWQTAIPFLSTFPSL